MNSSRRVNRVLALVAMLAWGVALASGCAGAGGSTTAGGARQRGHAPPKADAAAYRDPVAIGALRERALEVLSAAGTGPEPEQRANAMEALAPVPARLEPIVRANLVDENQGVRTVAAMMVGKAMLKNSLPFVEPLLADTSSRVRAAAIYAMRRCGASVDPTPLAGMLQDASPRVRAQAAFVLGELGDASAIPLLRQAARDPMSKASPSEVKIMQLQIAEARIKLGDDDALQELRAALYPARPEDMEATILAAQIIGQVKDRASMAPLIALTAMKDEAGNRMPAEAQLAAAGSLARLGAKQGGFIAREYAANPDPIRRAQAAFVFGETAGPENLPILEGMLADQEGTVRVSAAAAILKIAEAVAAMSQTGR